MKNITIKGQSVDRFSGLTPNQATTEEIHVHFRQANQRRGKIPSCDHFAILEEGVHLCYTIETA